MLHFFTSLSHTYPGEKAIHIDNVGTDSPISPQMSVWETNAAIYPTPIRKNGRIRLDDQTRMALLGMVNFLNVNCPTGNRVYMIYHKSIISSIPRTKAFEISPIPAG